MTVAVIAMLLFAIAFFGACCSSRSTSSRSAARTPSHAGLLLAPQGVGAMITMPIAGILADKIGPGKIVLAGITVITVGMVDVHPDRAPTHVVRLPASRALFVMGLGMGGTMMPIMTAALATLTRRTTIARGSTLLNIIQQVAASIGTAVFSVLLTNGLLDNVTATTPPAEIPAATADVYGTVFLIGAVAGRPGAHPGVLPAAQEDRAHRRPGGHGRH